MFLFFLTSGLFLGWTLGANDASNVFGSAVGSKMIKFWVAAVVASVFVVLGSVLQGFGGAETLGKLGAINAIGGAFTVALCAGLAVFWMTKSKIPVSTSQAIVGGIIGWNFYSSNPIDVNELYKIVSTWIAGPILGGVFAVMLFLLTKLVLTKSRIHLLTLDSAIKFSLLLVGAFGSYSLGANNIANVVGVFVPSIPKLQFDFGFFQLSSVQVLFLLGGLSIAAGILTYSKKVMKTVGSSLMKLNSETALIVVLAHSLVLFVFSSPALSNSVTKIGLPPIPMVPVSSSQAIVGAIIGIGLLKGGRNIQPKVVGKIVIGWIVTPIIAGILTFVSLFIISNVFKVEVVKTPSAEFSTSSPLKEDLGSKRSFNIDNEGFIDQIDLQKPLAIFVIVLLVLGLILLIGMFIRQNQKNKIQGFNDRLEKYDIQQKVLENELRIKELAAEDLKKENERKIVEKRGLALSILKKNELLKNLKVRLEELGQGESKSIEKKEYQKIMDLLTKSLDSKKERELLSRYLDESEDDFYKNLGQLYPSLTEFEKKMCSLIRFNFKTEDISSILNEHPHEVKEIRKELVKKMKLQKGEKIQKILKKI